MPNTFIPSTFVGSRRPVHCIYKWDKGPGGSDRSFSFPNSKALTRKARRAASQDERQKVALLAWEKFHACTAWAACACQKESRSCLALFLPKGSNYLETFKLLPNTFATKKGNFQGRRCTIGTSLADRQLLKNLLAIVSCEQVPIAQSACSAFLKGKGARCGTFHTSVHTSLYRDRVGAFWQQALGRSK